MSKFHILIQCINGEIPKIDKWTNMWKTVNKRIRGVARRRKVGGGGGGGAQTFFPEKWKAKKKKKKKKKGHSGV